MFRLILCVLALATASCASLAGGPSSDPCQDPRYLALRAQPVDSLSEREFELLKQRDQACLDGRDAASAPGERRVSARVEPHLIEATTESAYGGGWYVFIQNHSDAVVVITGINLVECRNIRGSCGMKRMNVELAPGQRERVMIVRPRPGGGDSHFRYTYQYKAYRQ